MTLFSTGVIENRKRKVTNLSISVSNESSLNATAIVEVYYVPYPGMSNGIVYFLNEFSLNPFNTTDSIVTFENVYANFDRFGVRVTTDGAGANNVATADGSECHPFLTVSAAMASITDASPAKRYAISIGPGTFTEALIHLKANVQLVGTSTLLTRLAIPFDINDPSWFETGFINDNRSGFVDLSLLTAPLDFNFVSEQL